MQSVAASISLRWITSGEVMIGPDLIIPTSPIRDECPAKLQRCSTRAEHRGLGSDRRDRGGRGWLAADAGDWLMATYRLCADHVFPGSIFVPRWHVSSAICLVVCCRLRSRQDRTWMHLTPMRSRRSAAAGVQLIGSCVRMSSLPACRWVTDPNAGPGNPFRQYVISGPLGVRQVMQQLLGTRGAYP